MAIITDILARNMAPRSKSISDGVVTGLSLHPGSVKGRGKWILRYVSPVAGNRRDMGLGTYPNIGIANARAKANAARQEIVAGRDPIDERNARKRDRRTSAAVLCFSEATKKVHAELSPAWKNTKHKAQWLTTMRDYVFPYIGKCKVDILTPADFADVLRPIWLSKPETASRVKQRCHTVIKWCWACGLVQGNPLDVVDHLLPQQPAKRIRVQHQPAMPWKAVPKFVANVLHNGKTNVTRAIIEFTILTAARSGEVRAICWEEIGFANKIWTIPAERMKTGVEHRVPLSARAIAILHAQRVLHPDTDLVFPSIQGKVLSDMVMTKFLRDRQAPSSTVGRTATMHGFRSTFRDWASENGYARDLAERALAHTITNQSEAAYHRTDLLEQRRAMMEAWAKYVQSLHRPDAHSC